jgi:hypothetical protein
MECECSAITCSEIVPVLRMIKNFQITWHEFLVSMYYKRR